MENNMDLKTTTESTPSTDTRDLRAQLKNQAREKTLLFLKALILRKDLHYKWLNTLSFLEYLGCRKIVKSQKASSLKPMFMEHIAEEARHAYFFKRLALRMAPEHLDLKDLDYREAHLFVGEEAEAYFQGLDKGLHQALQSFALSETHHRFLTYLYVTLLVEERALELYELYGNLLQEQNLSIKLDAVVKEEHKHLNQMRELLTEADPQFQKRYEVFCSLELQLYHKLMNKCLEALHLSVRGSSSEKRAEGRGRSNEIQTSARL